MQRLNFVTLGVKDLPKSKQFWKDMFGWSPFNKEEEVAFYDMGGWVLALFGWKHLADDAKLSPEGSGFRGISLAHNVREKFEVARLLEKAQALGGKVIKPAEDVFWGGHSGYFQDLDGHLWEVAWNPFLPVKPDGSLDIRHPV